MLIRIDDHNTKQSLYSDNDRFTLVFDDGIEYNLVKEDNKLIIRSVGKINKVVVLPRAANAIEIVSIK